MAMMMTMYCFILAIVVQLATVRAMPGGWSSINIQDKEVQKVFDLEKKPIYFPPEKQMSNLLSAKNQVSSCRMKPNAL